MLQIFYILQSVDTLNAPYTTLVNNVLGGDRQRWLAWAVYKRNTQCYANLKKTSYFEIKYYFTVLSTKLAISTRGIPVVL